MSSAAAPRQPNRLAHETSPYLLQHAWNPVDWYPWGDEAFERARAEDKLVFLSVGYSACHWCHVMEHESFENDAIAALLNEHFISIKVDREERPDVDQIYMTAVQLITQRGGWPMSVFLTPDRQPVFGGTYWPPTSRFGMPGFRDILTRLHEIWRTQRDEALAAGARITDAIDRLSAQEYDAVELHDDLLRGGLRMLIATADRKEGGFGGAPKFPHPMDLRLLLRCWRRFQDGDALDVARITLDHMAAGGIYDHLGGGFHRYSTDARWLVPHFEKMLYDNALLAPTYLEAWQITGEPRYEEVVRETLDYVLREMTQPEGGFYSTQDADSEGEEGKFFVWTADEVSDVLGAETARIFNETYDVTRHGNWEGKSVLNRPRTDATVALRLGIKEETLHEKLSQARWKLFEIRSRRIAPGRDDKVLANWNGMMIAALAQAGRVLGDARYTSAAEDAAKFVLGTMTDPGGRLLHSYKDGRARFAAYLDDYAAMIDGLVELYQATFDAQWLEAGLRLAASMQRHFADPVGGFFYTADDHERLLTRSKDLQDNATPSGNALAATALLKLGRLTGRTDVEEAGYRTLVTMSGLMAEHPRAAAQALLALDFHLGPSFELVIVDGPDRSAGDATLSDLARNFAPQLILVRRPPGISDEQLPESLRPLCAGRRPETRTTYYICERGACQLPRIEPDGLREALGLK